MKMNSKKSSLIAFMMLALLFLTACGAGANASLDLNVLLPHAFVQDSEELTGIEVPENIVNESTVAQIVYQPVKIEIPKLRVNTDVVNVGILENGEMGVPDNDVEVGWYELGSSPGEQGSAVMAGHVDTREGPGVFFYLKDLIEGDEIHITMEDGSVLIFAVNKVESYITDEAPTDIIFGDSDKVLLNLITCTGTFDRSTRDHEKRLVVYSELIDHQDELPLATAPLNDVVN